MARPRSYDDTTRHELVRAAAALISKDGPAALSVRGVAEAVGASTTAIYGLFGSKSGLVRAMFVAGFESLAARFEATAATDDPVEDLLGLGLAYRANAVAEPHLYEVMFGRPFPEFTPDEADAALALGTLDVLRAAVQRCVDAGVLPDHAEVEDVTLALWALTHGLASLELAGSLGGRGESFWREQLTAHLAGLQAPLRARAPEP